MPDSSIKQLTRKILGLGSGETLARLCGIATVIFLARRCGVVVVGVYALAQSMLQYSYPFIDFGLRHVGARLVAKYPEASGEIVERVQKRRLLMGGLILPLLLLYAAFTNLPWELKVFLILFSAVGCLYAVSLEWAAWGKDNLRLIGITRALPPGGVLLFLLLGRNSEHVLWWMIAGNLAGYGLQGLVFWKWWEAHKPAQDQPASLALIRESLAWRRTSIMGLAWFCNLAFNSIDMLMLGIMSNPQQVGLYSAAYRTMNQVLFTYYLLIQALYPRFARQEAGQRSRALQPKILLMLFGAGLAIALALSASARFVLTIVFGRQFLPATFLLLLLAWAIPLDFLTSYLSNAYIAWNMEKKVLTCTLIAAGSNVVLNLIWIPSHGATAAAINTLISYVIFLAGLAMAGRYAHELAGEPQPQADMVGLLK
jgi:O-antigen/teichoic acid export membrane protein